MVNVNDGKYTGKLTPEQVIEQFEYRILIHESYAGLVVQNPSYYPPRIYGDYDYQMWAINGYRWGIKYIQLYIDGAIPAAKPKSSCILSQAIITCLNTLWMISRRKTRFEAVGQ